MICVNELTDLKCYKKEVLEQLLILIAPYAPHISEELWIVLGNTGTILDTTFPKWNDKYLKETSKAYPVAINGKTRTELTPGIGYYSTTGGRDCNERCDRYKMAGRETTQKDHLC
jgi:leucyl-tRNA synthetase